MTIGVYFEIRLEWGWLELNGVSMAHAAWGCPDLSPLWGRPAPKGSDVPMPYAATRPGPKRHAGGDLHALRFVCTGVADIDGGPPNLNPYRQCQENMTYLHDNVFAPVDAGDGTIPAVWTLPDATTVTADVSVRFPKDGVSLHDLGVLRGTIELIDARAELHLPGLAS